MKYKKILVLLLSTILTLMIFTSCGSTPAEKVQKNGNEISSKIVISGLENGETEISMEEIKKLTSYEKEVTSVNSGGDEKTFTVKGAKFDDILKKINVSKESIKAIRFYARDGYTVEVPEEVIKNRDILIAYIQNNEELKDDGPAKIVIPDERAMYWVKKLQKIEILNEVKKYTVTKIYFPETLKDKLVEFNDFDGKNDAYKCTDMLDLINPENKPDFVTMKAVDRVEKNEKIDIFQKGFIKITGTEIPSFTFDGLPNGMHVKNILHIAYGEASCFFYDSGKDYFKTVNTGDKEAIKLDDIIKEVGLGESNSYTIKALDGYEIKLEKDKISKAIIYKNNDGQMVFEVLGGDKKQKVKNLMYIEAK